MDFFGIGQAMKCMIELYTMSSRATGRSTSLADSVREGDRVVFLNNDELNHLRIMLHQRDIYNVTLVVISSLDPEKVFNIGPPSTGRTIFDHGWIEAFYERVITDAGKRLDYVETQSSGYGEAHRETKRKAQEILRYRR